ncbi:MAG: HAD family hydrolase [Thermodesulfobacteriota bacterium]
MNIAVFMDRDGTINEETGYLKDPCDLNILPRALDAIRLINENQIKAVVITNQSGVARGYFTEEMVEKIHVRLRELLGENGVYLDGIYYCPHHPEIGPPEYRKKCNCRKPAPGMLNMASAELEIDLSHSYVIGDKLTDIEPAYKVGAKGILVLTGYGKDQMESLNERSKRQPHYIARDILEAVNWILHDLHLNIKSTTIG